MNKVKELAHDTASFAKDIFNENIIPLHRPIFEGNEKKYLIECIDSNFVSSVGAKVTEFEEKISSFTGSKYAIATVNGTAALHTSIFLSDVKPGDEVITQSLTFIATCNAISYVGAKPIFIDVDIDTMGLSPNALRKFLEENAEKRKNGTFNKKTGNKISACVPMHTFGFPCRIEKIAEICSEWSISLIEDAAESLGSYVKNSHTGTFSSMATLSFNGNKIITTGGGGMIITDNADLALRAKHLTTTAKVPHAYEFFHDEIGYNYRLPNINAALGCAQMEMLDEFLYAKKQLADKWNDFFTNRGIDILQPIDGCKPNYWLSAIILNCREDRDAFLSYTNSENIMTRPIWTLMSNLPMFKDCQSDSLKNSLWLEERVVNLPSSVAWNVLKK